MAFGSRPELEAAYLQGDVPAPERICPFCGSRLGRLFRVGVRLRVSRICESGRSWSQRSPAVRNHPCKQLLPVTCTFMAAVQDCSSLAFITAITCLRGPNPKALSPNHGPALSSLQPAAPEFTGCIVQASSARTCMRKDGDSLCAYGKLP